MKKILLFVLAGIIFSSFIAPAQEIKFPHFLGYVNDYANIISASDKSYLEKLLVQLEKKTTAEVAVVTLTTTQPYDIELYAVKLFEKWGIGKKGKDNGLLLLVALKDRKLRIEVGYGLEGAIPDAIAKMIIEKNIIPYFKRGNYSAGIVAGVNEIVSKILKEYGLSDSDLVGYEPLATSQEKGIANIIWFLFMFLLLFGLRSGFLFFWLLPPGYWSSGRGGFGGGFGGFGGGLSGGGGASGSW